jgi:hypothetical protein
MVNWENTVGLEEVVSHHASLSVKEEAPISGDSTYQGFQHWSQINHADPVMHADHFGDWTP